MHTVNLTAHLPLGLVLKSRVYYSSHLDKIPILTYLSKTVGHFPVKFKSGDYKNFTVDQEAMKPIQVDTSLMPSNLTHACTYREHGAVFYLQTRCSNQNPPNPINNIS